MRSISLLAMELAALLLTVGISNSSAFAQKGLRDARLELKVAGRVVRLYESDDQRQLVELQLSSVAIEGDLASATGMPIPAPGRTVYVVVVTPTIRSDRPSSAKPDLPRVGTPIRTRLIEAGAGIWEANLDSFEFLDPGASGDLGESEFEDVPTTVDVLGMICQVKLFGGRFTLEVKRVDENGPAKQAGFQPGDLVVAVNGRPLSSATDLVSASRGQVPVKLAVVDVNTGRLAEVKLTPAVKPSASRSSRTAEPRVDADSPARRIATSLGIGLESTRIGPRRVLKVTAVDLGSAGADAGLEKGDEIVGIGDKRVSSVEEFADSIPARPGTISLLVRDVRTNQEVPIVVNASGTISKQLPKSTIRRDAARSNTSTGELGIVGELTFYDAEAAVKVVRVTPGSAADRAGVRPGMILRSADGQPLMHPDELAKAEEKASGTLTLLVVDPSTKRESSVIIKL